MDNIHSKYFTPIKVAKALMELIKINNDANVVDICCGSCNLLNAAKERNNQINCTGVDIIQCDTKYGFDLFSGDGREFALKNKGKYQISLANPPFGKETKKIYTKNLYSGIYENISVNRIEVEMLIANLLILDESGLLVIIIPTTIVNGLSYIHLRKILSKYHFIDSIIDLPIDAFYPERIKCSALIIRKEPNNSNTKYYKMNNDFKLLKTREIDLLNIKKGNWNGKSKITNIDFNIHQGRIPTSFFTGDNNDNEVLHTSKSSTNWRPSVRYAVIPEKNKYIKVADGDILISRIGSSAGEKCVYYGTEKYISDCLLVVKEPNEITRNRIMDLDFSSIVGGLSTPHITIQNIYNLYNETYY